MQAIFTANSFTNITPKSGWTLLSFDHNAPLATQLLVKQQRGKVSKFF